MNVGSAFDWYEDHRFDEVLLSTSFQVYVQGR